MGTDCPFTLTTVFFADLSLKQYNSLSGAASSRAHPGIRTFTEKVERLAGATVISVSPSQGMFPV